jgi:hypothetical protein
MMLTMTRVGSDWFFFSPSFFLLAFLFSFVPFNSCRLAPCCRLRNNHLDCGRRRGQPSFCTWRQERNIAQSGQDEQHIRTGAALNGVAKREKKRQSQSPPLWASIHHIHHIRQKPFGVVAARNQEVQHRNRLGWCSTRTRLVEGGGRRRGAKRRCCNRTRLHPAQRRKSVGRSAGWGLVVHTGLSVAVGWRCGFLPSGWDWLPSTLPSLPPFTDLALNRSGACWPSVSAFTRRE